jgi:hypothetical protein
MKGRDIAIFRSQIKKLENENRDLQSTNKILELDRDSLLQHRQQSEFATKNAINERGLVQQRLQAVIAEFDQVRPLINIEGKSII